MAWNPARHFPKAFTSSLSYLSIQEATSLLQGVPLLLGVVFLVLLILSAMSADPEREPLLSARPREDSTSEDEQLEPGAVSETVAVRIFLLTTVRGRGAHPFHWGNLR